jgi:thioredoxin 1
MKKRSEHRWLSTEEIMDQMDSIRKLAVLCLFNFMLAAVSLVIVAEEPAETMKSGLTLEVYSATWCGPCKRFAPVIDRACKAEGVTYRKNVISGSFPASWKRLGIRSVPTVRFVKDGREVYRCGPLSESSLRAVIRKHK